MTSPITSTQTKNISLINYEQKVKNLTNRIKNIYHSSNTLTSSKEERLELESDFEQIKKLHLPLKKDYLLHPEFILHYGKLRDYAVTFPRNYRIVTNPQDIERKLKKQLKCAKMHMRSQKTFVSRIPPRTPLFSYLRAPEILNQKNPAYADFTSDSKNLGDLGFIGVTQGKNTKQTQEDTYVKSIFDINLPNGTSHQVLLTGVFDGHGGSEVSSFMKRELKTKLQRTFNHLFSGTLPEESPLKALETEKNLDVIIWNVLKIACVELDEECGHLSKKAGSTAAFSLLIDGEDLWHVNIGDSRSILVGYNGNVIQLSEDMIINFDFPTDLTRDEFNSLQSSSNRNSLNSYEYNIWKRGGFTANYRINGNLMPARSIGDHRVGIGVYSRPKITKISLSEKFPDSGLCLLLHASDGLWDVANTLQVAEGMLAGDETADPEIIAKDLVYSALEAGSQDNITAVVTLLDLDALSKLNKFISDENLKKDKIQN